jgi:hypothetical protein
MEIIEIGFLILLITLILKTFRESKRASTNPRAFPVVGSGRVNCDLLQIGTKCYRRGEMLDHEDIKIIEKTNLFVSTPVYVRYVLDDILVIAINHCD